MKIYTLLLLSYFFAFKAFSQNSLPIINEVKIGLNPLDTLRFDEITACNINYDQRTKRKTYNQTSQNVNDYKLYLGYANSFKNVDSSLFRNIVTIFSDTSTYGNNYADCFEPRFVLQFKLKNEEKFRIIICQGCRYLISSVPIPAPYLKYYDNQYEENGTNVIWRRYLKGFSEEGALKINNLCKAIGLSYCSNN